MDCFIYYQDKDIMMNPTVYRKDYQAFAFDIEKVHLVFDLDTQNTQVCNTMYIRSKQSAPTDLVLNLEEIQIQAIYLNNTQLEPKQYELNDRTLTIKACQGEFELKIINTCCPRENSSLMGLYESGQSLFTQCEAEGFRRITPFADRPDVMSLYTVTLKADPARYPFLLSNGNLIQTKTLEDGRQEAIWQDPFKKPCYLFALVAGNFDVRERQITTRSGRPALLQIYSDPGNGDKTLWALDSLERAIKWDESRFDLELDLERFMVVAVNDFNMGAMENKGLNIFNAAYALADPETATDESYEAIEAVIGHEYFHNWTGNRVTCRDWFQLSLKEGLTVFRDQEFSADMMAQGLPPQAAASARAVKRIDDVNVLRVAQFPEDSGPMAHPIRPDSYEEIGNFYTLTVYEKGAEVIRMQHTLLGEKGFQEGMKCYFERHDGQAVTCDDFVNAMDTVYRAQNPGKSLDQFRRWYSQAGTPTVSVVLDYDPKTKTCEINLSQHCPAVGVEKLRSNWQKQPYHIPFALGMLDQQGKEILPTQLLQLTEETQTFHFDQIPERPVLSLLRDFSAPIKLHYPAQTRADLVILALHDTNAFNRYEAKNQLAIETLLSFYKDPKLSIPNDLIQVWQSNLSNPNFDANYRNRLLSLPSEKLLYDLVSPIDPIAIRQAHLKLTRALGEALKPQWQALLETHLPKSPYQATFQDAGKRSLLAQALNYLLAIQDTQAIEVALNLYEQADNMTDRFNSLSLVCKYLDKETQTPLLAQFFNNWKDNALVLNKWFTLQASHAQYADIQALVKHPSFTLRNPNRARAVIGSFCQNNPLAFHASDGSGYAFWADQIIALDAINPEIAARLARIMDQWSLFTQADLMKAQLERVKANTQSANVQEIVNKALNIH